MWAGMPPPPDLSNHGNNYGKDRGYLCRLGHKNYRCAENGNFGAYIDATLLSVISSVNSLAKPI